MDGSGNIKIKPILYIRSLQAGGLTEVEAEVH
jgi:hypothetical protein